ncbi:SDR family oxidoreductase [Paradesertivirga mongoliensis]|uniref:dTDP-4-dehydrorhamnose reductase n=1 Tax=Paradesertivirga mongoliensis TaxID=2100740 RepID=A0ABW4ZHQ4_9SPHI|nr:SDR family oxidoreductase [Pedobacter mongoliensis]
MKKILVTGSNGLLGQTLSSLILSTGRAHLIASSRGADRFNTPGDYVYLDLDITDKEKLYSSISLHKPDVIINTAAVTNVDVCHHERDLCWQLNVTAVQNLVSICEDKNIHLIHISTDFVFDGKAGPYNEDALPNPVSYYGQSKYEAEQIVRRSSYDWTILRTILVYGVTPNMSRSNIVLWAKSALEKGEDIKVVNDQWRMPTLALDLAEACLLAAERKATGIFHISGMDMMSVYDIVRAVADFWSLDKSHIHPISSELLNQEAKRPQKTGFILDKAIRHLGYQPHSFREGLEIVDKDLDNLNRFAFN